MFDFSGLQIVIVVLLSELHMIIFTHRRQNVMRYRFIMQLFNEFSIMISIMHLIGYSYFNLNFETHIWIAYTYITNIFIVIIVNIYLVVMIYFKRLQNVPANKAETANLRMSIAYLQNKKHEYKEKRTELDF